jgi:hypothetical protein
MTRVRRRWIVYRNDECLDGQDQSIRHLVCEACRGETECDLAIGDNRHHGWVPLQRWYTVPTSNYRLPPCEECLAGRAWKEQRGYRMRAGGVA